MGRYEERRKLETDMKRSLVERAKKGDKLAWKAAFMLVKTHGDKESAVLLSKVAKKYGWWVFFKRALLYLKQSGVDV